MMKFHSNFLAFFLLVSSCASAPDKILHGCVSEDSTSDCEDWAKLSDPQKGYDHLNPTILRKLCLLHDASACPYYEKGVGAELANLMVTDCEKRNVFCEKKISDENYLKSLSIVHLYHFCRLGYPSACYHLVSRHLDGSVRNESKIAPDFLKDVAENLCTKKHLDSCRVSQGLACIFSDVDCPAWLGSLEDNEVLRLGPKTMSRFCEVDVRYCYALASILSSKTDGNDILELMEKSCKKNFKDSCEKLSELKRLENQREVENTLRAIESYRTAELGITATDRKSVWVEPHEYNATRKKFGNRCKRVFGEEYEVSPLGELPFSCGFNFSKDLKDPPREIPSFNELESAVLAALKYPKSKAEEASRILVRALTKVKKAKMSEMQCPKGSSLQGSRVDMLFSQGEELSLVPEVKDGQLTGLETVIGSFRLRESSAPDSISTVSLKWGCEIAHLRQRDYCDRGGEIQFMPDPSKPDCAVDSCPFGGALNKSLGKCLVCKTNMKLDPKEGLCKGKVGSEK